MGRARLKPAETTLCCALCYTLLHCALLHYCPLSQALFRHHSAAPGFRIAHEGSALDPPLRDGDEEMQDAMFCFCPAGHGETLCAYHHAGVALVSFDRASMGRRGNVRRAGLLLPRRLRSGSMSAQPKPERHFPKGYGV